MNNKYRTLRKYFKTSILLLITVWTAAVFQSCLNDSDIVQEGQAGEFDGRITVRVNVADAEVVKTRGDQTDDEKLLDGASEHFVLLYKKEEGEYRLYRKVKVDLEGDVAVVWLTVPKSFDLDNAKIVVVANVPSEEAEAFSELNEDEGLDRLLRITTEGLGNNTQPASPFIMSGAAKKTDDRGNFTVDLHRTAAKVSFEVSEEVDNFSLSEYSMYNAPSIGYFTAFVASDEELKDLVYSEGENVYTVTEQEGFSNYTYPVRSAGREVENITGSYFIVKGMFEGEEGYYRVDLRKEDGEYYDVDPNHWYQVEIVKVSRKGYATPEEAASKYMGMEEDTSIEVRILDHSPDVLSITTDGIRELGTRETVEMTGDTYGLVVKCFTPYDSEYGAGNLKAEVIDGVDWLEIKGGPAEKALEGDDTGRQWVYTLSLKNAQEIFTDKTATVRVSWMGLIRDVTVNYNADFQPDKICKSDLRFNYLSSGNIAFGTMNDYWGFLKQNISGIDPSSMADGKIRNEGFHFPMPYGEDDQWVYEYDLSFTLEGSSWISTITIEVTGDPFFKENLDWVHEPNKTTGVLKLKNLDRVKDNFTYATGKVTFKIKFDEDRGLEDKSFTVDLYHTGFFDFNSGMTQHCHYYEVVPMGKNANGETLYWLDRNIGAESNKMYVDNEGFSEGKEAARGLFYKIYNANKEGEPVSLFSAVCPPGYTVPNTTDWDNIRLSPDFKTGSITQDDAVITATYYSTGVKGIGNVYFPKGRFYNSTANLADGARYSEMANMGDPGAGYYWTSSIPSGLQNDETGGWMRVLNLTGASNTYINGSLKNQEMNVRCIAIKSSSPETKSTIAFNVKGATHVYLYTSDSNGNKNGLFTFPGKTIGSEGVVNGLVYDPGSDAYQNSYLHFSCTTTRRAEELKVLFVKKSDNGSIKIISSNGAGSLEAAEGWPVMVGHNYFFSPADFMPVENQSGEFPWLNWN